VSTATLASEASYEDRSQRRKEIALTLANIFQNLEKNCQNDEEAAGARKAMEHGMAWLKGNAEEDLDELAQADINRETPVLGEGPIGSDDFDGVPMSPIGND